LNENFVYWITIPITTKPTFHPKISQWLAQPSSLLLSTALLLSLSLHGITQLVKLSFVGFCKVKMEQQPLSMSLDSTFVEHCLYYSLPLSLHKTIGNQKTPVQAHFPEPTSH